jgi:hypothetical protein
MTRAPSDSLEAMHTCPSRVSAEHADGGNQGWRVAVRRHSVGGIAATGTRRREPEGEGGREGGREGGTRRRTRMAACLSLHHCYTCTSILTGFEPASCAVARVSSRTTHRPTSGPDETSGLSVRVHSGPQINTCSEGGREPGACLRRLMQLCLYLSVHAHALALPFSSPSSFDTLSPAFTSA